MGFINKKSMNKYLKIGLVLILVLLTILVLSNIKQTYFKSVELSNDNIVFSRSDMNYLDTIVCVGLDELDIKGVRVYIRAITLPKEADFVIKAHIVQSTVNTTDYLIEIDNSDRDDIITTLSHELIHLQQLNTGKLKNSKDYVIWNSDTIRNPPTYFDREWEKEASKLGSKLEVKIKNRLYE